MTRPFHDTHLRPCWGIRSDPRGDVPGFLEPAAERTAPPEKKSTGRNRLVSPARGRNGYRTLRPVATQFRGITASDAGFAGAARRSASQFISPDRSGRNEHLCPGGPGCCGVIGPVPSATLDKPTAFQAVRNHTTFLPSAKSSFEPMAGTHKRRVRDAGRRTHARSVSSRAFYSWGLVCERPRFRGGGGFTSRWMRSCVFGWSTGVYPVVTSSIRPLRPIQTCVGTLLM